MVDNVNKPAHYQGKVECIEAIEAAVEGLEGLEAVCTANVIKYVWRWKKKNGREDCYKAKWYLNKLIDEIMKSKCSEYEQKQFGLKNKKPIEMATEYANGDEIKGRAWEDGFVAGIEYERNRAQI